MIAKLQMKTARKNDVLRKKFFVQTINQFKNRVFEMKIARKIKLRSNSSQKRKNLSLKNICVLFFLLSSSVGSLAQEITEFPIYSNNYKSPHQATFSSLSNVLKTLIWFDQPVGVAVSADGSVWFTENNASRIGRRGPDGVVKEYQIGGPHGIRNIPNRPNITIGGDGNIWFTTGQQIDRITPSGVVTMYPDSYSSDSEICTVTLGADGNVWYTKRPHGEKNNSIGKITPDGKVTEFQLATSLMPMNLTAGPDGNIWFTEYSGKPFANPGEPPKKLPLLRVAKITSDGKITEFTDGITIATSLDDHVVSGRDNKLWIIPDSGGSIASITTDGHVTEYPLDSDIFLSGYLSVTKGSGDDLWISSGAYDIVGRITLPNKVEIYHFPESKLNVGGTAAGETGITAGLNNDLWITSNDHGSLEHVTFGKQAFLSGFDPALPTKEIVEMLKRPTTSIKLLQNIKIAIDMDLPSRDDFYTSENLEKVFGVDNIKIEENSYKKTDKEKEIVRKAEFKNNEGIEFIVLKRKNSLNDARFIAEIGLNSPVGEGILEFNSIQKIFGSNWKSIRHEFDSGMLDDKVIENDYNDVQHVITIRTPGWSQGRVMEIGYTETTEGNEHGN